MEKSRRETVSVSGEYGYWVNTPGGATPLTKLSKDVAVSFQETDSVWTGWPLVRPYIRGKGRSSTEADRLMTEIFSKFDYGSAFRTEKSSMSSTLSNVMLSPSWSNDLFKAYINHKGPVFLAGFSPLGLSTELDWSNNFQIMFGLGGTAIARCRPNKPMISLPVTVGELKKDGIPTIIGSLMRRSQSVKDVFRNGGSEYLNVQFGWLPLLRDIQALCETAAQSRRILEQYEKDVGKLIRRRYHFDPTVSSTTGLSFPSNPSSYALQPGTPLGSLNGVCVRIGDGTLSRVQENTQVTTKSWFSGGFRYYFPDVASGLEYFARIEREANTLLGTRLDPEVLWNLAPWTWLADWFVNAGDVVSNLSALIADDLVMQYGYIMRTVTLDKVISLPGLQVQTNSGWKTAGGPFDVTLTRVQKARAKASPFGFGLNPSDFTADQWAILGALGMSRGVH